MPLSLRIFTEDRFLDLAGEPAEEAALQGTHELLGRIATDAAAIGVLVNLFWLLAAPSRIPSLKGLPPKFGLIGL